MTFGLIGCARLEINCENLLWELELRFFFCRRRGRRIKKQLSSALRVFVMEGLYFSLVSALIFENIILSQDSNNVANKYKKQVEIGLRKKFSLLWEVSWVASPVSWEMWESRLGIKQCHFYLGNRFFSALWEGRPFNVKSSGFILF